MGESKETLECYRHFQSAVDNQFTEFFLSYTQEEYDDVYRNSYDPDNPYTHLIKTFFADVLSLQVNNLASTPYCHLYFLPILMILKDNKKSGAFWKLNHPEIITNGQGINNGDCFNNFVDNFIATYKSKDEIESGIIDFDQGIFPDLFLGAGKKTMSDMDIEADIAKLADKRSWQAIACNSSHTGITNLLNGTDEEPIAGENSYKAFLMTYNDKPDKRGERKSIQFLVVFFVSNLLHTANRCSSTTCEIMLREDLIHNSLKQLFAKLFYISVNLEKFVISSKEHDDLIAEKQKGTLFEKIQEPLKTMIDDLTRTTNLVAFIDRQLNPTWLSFLKLPQNKDVVRIFEKYADLKYKTKNDDGQVKEDSVTGIHDFESDYNEAEHDSFLKNIDKYVLYLIKEVKKDFDASQIQPNISYDILVLLYDVLQKESSLANRYSTLRFLKLIAYDIQDSNKALTFLQILFFTLLSKRKGTGGDFSYYLIDECETNWDTLINTPAGLTKFMKTKIYGATIQHYKDVHDKTPNVQYPTIELAGGISAGEFCGALAGLIGEELQGEKKDVNFKSVHIASLGNEGKHIGITIRCDGMFDDKSIIRKLDDNMHVESLYHGMRNTLNTIEKALGAKRRFEKDETKYCSHPFVFYSNKEDKETVIRITLGDTFTEQCKYTDGDYNKF